MTDSAKTAPLGADEMPHMKYGAAIVNTGSVTGLEGSGGLLDSSATKGAIGRAAP